MPGVQKAQLGLVGFVLVAGVVSCLITSRPTLASYIRQATYTKTISMGVSLALVLVHMVPVGFAQLQTSKNVWMQSFASVYFAAGVMLGISIQTWAHKFSPFVVEAHVVTSLSQATEDPLPQRHECVLSNTTERPLGATIAPMTLEQTLYYPQYYNWDTMSNLHCNSVLAVTQLEDALSKEYPFIPQKEDIVLQNFPQFNIPNYIQNSPQIVTAQYNNAYIDEVHNTELERIGAETARQRTYGVVASCVLYGFFLGLTVGSTHTIDSLLMLLPSVLEFLVVQCFVFATSTQDADGLQKHTASTLCMLCSLPIAAITFFVLHIEHEHEHVWKIPIRETTALLMLISAGFLLYHTVSTIHTDMPKTRINIIIIAVVMTVSCACSRTRN